MFASFFPSDCGTWIDDGDRVRVLASEECLNRIVTVYVSNSIGLNFAAKHEDEMIEIADNTDE